MFRSLFVYFLVLLRTFNSGLDDLILSLHLFEFYLLVLLSQLQEQIIFNKSQSNTFIAVSTCSAHSMDICSRAQFFIFLRFRVVDDKRDCPNINTPSDSLCSQQYLNLFVFEFLDPSSFGSCAIIRMDVIWCIPTDFCTFTVNVINH